MKQRRLLLAAALCAACGRGRRPDVDLRLASVIEHIRIIDDHAHPLKVVMPGEPPDSEYDALIYEGMEQPVVPVRLRPENPEWLSAWQFLYGVSRKDEVAQRRTDRLKEHGDRYTDWVLDRLGVQTMLANRVASGRGLDRRFRWIPFVDALMYPLNNTSLIHRNPDYGAFYTAEERLLDRFFREAGITNRPVTLDGYLPFVTTTLERMKRQGAVALKFEAAYLRSLDIGNPGKAEAERVYAIFFGGGEPTAEDYKSLQDYLFRYIALEAARLDLPIQIHVSAGVGNYFNLAGANPLLLEPVLNDPALRRTKFIIVHGGWPFTKETAFLLLKPNVYTDFSAQTWLTYPRALAGTLRGWLEFAPEKVMFGSDATPMSPEAGWEETAWMSVTSGREALGIALTAMLRDRELTRADAERIARMVLHDNAAALYRLQ